MYLVESKSLRLLVLNEIGRHVVVLSGVVPPGDKQSQAVGWGFHHIDQQLHEVQVTSHGIVNHKCIIVHQSHRTMCVVSTLQPKLLKEKNKYSVAAQTQSKSNALGISTDTQVYMLLWSNAM